MTKDEFEELKKKTTIEQARNLLKQRVHEQIESLQAIYTELTEKHTPSSEGACMNNFNADSMVAYIRYREAMAK